MKYVVFKADSYEPENLVLYAYSLDVALELAADKATETGTDWSVAVVLE